MVKTFLLSKFLVSLRSAWADILTTADSTTDSGSVYKRWQNLLNSLRQLVTFRASDSDLESDVPVIQTAFETRKAIILTFGTENTESKPIADELDAFHDYIKQAWEKLKELLQLLPAWLASQFGAAAAAADKAQPQLKLSGIRLPDFWKAMEISGWTNFNRAQWLC